MLNSIFGNADFQALTGGLNASSMREQVIANNLANANTPGYKRQTVSFESSLDAALKQNANTMFAVPQAPISSIQPKVITDSTTSTRTDGNNVDPDVENADLATNTIHYETIAQSATNYFKDVMTAVLGR